MSIGFVCEWVERVGLARIPSFDIAKGVAVSAVIVGHTSYAGVPQSVVDFCYSFDMPLFFLVSGFFCKKVDSIDFAYVRKNAKALLLPYLVTGVIIIALMAVRGLFFEDESVLSNILRWTVAALYGSGGTYAGMPEGVVGIGAIWYLFALFWAKLFLAAANASRCPLPIVIGCFVVGYSTGDSFWLPWSIQPALCAVAFLYVGQKVSECDILGKGALHPLVWALMLFAWLCCGINYGQLYMVSNTYAHGAIDVVGGLAGSLCVIKGAELASCVAPSLVRPIELLGRITLPVFCMHLVELNVIPWQQVMNYLAVAPVPVWVSVLAVRVIAIVLLCVALWTLPRRVSGIFYNAKKVEK